MAKLPADFEVMPSKDVFEINKTLIDRVEYANLKRLRVTDGSFKSIQSGGSVYKTHVIAFKEHEKRTIPADFDFSLFPYLLELSIGNQHQYAEFPASIGKLQHLRVLIFQNNTGCEKFPPGLKLSRHLEELTLSGNKFDSIPPILQDPPRLNSLQLGPNPLHALPGWIDECVNLQVLSLREIGLEALPGDLQTLKWLSELDASHNRLAVLPEWVGELTNLTKLDLEANSLTYLPGNSIGKLDKLKYLNIASNKLKEIPESIGELPEDLSLFLGENPLPDALYAMLNTGQDKENAVVKLRRFFHAREA
jgi:Leucine-rich repeat (LRR) protein